MKKLLLLIFLALSLFSKDIIFGVVPQESPLKLSQNWLKITAYLSKETGMNVIFKTENSIPAFEKRLYAGGYDLAYMNPYHFVLANKTKSYEAIARANKMINGIVVSKDKELKTNQLAGKNFLFPAPNAFAATLLVKFEFKKKFGFDIDKDGKVVYVNSHDSVYKGVARDIGDFGGGINRTYNNFKDQDKEALNIIYKTDAYPSHPIAYNPKIDTKTALKFQKAFLNMPKELKDLLSIEQFISTKTSEYDTIKQFDK